MELKIYDGSLNRQGIIDDFFSLIWDRKYYEPGNFELHLPLINNNLSLIKPNYLISKKGSVEAGIVESIEYIEGTNNKELIAKGRFLSSILDRRVIKTIYSFNGYAELAMYDLVDICDSFPCLVLAQSQGYTEEVTFQVTMKNLLTTLSKIGKSTNLGFRIVPDFKEKSLTFEVYKGLDRSILQTTNSRVVFSEAYDNLNMADYTWNTQLAKTKAIVGGEGEGSQRVYVTVGSGSGFDLKELFVDAKDINSDDFDTNAKYLDALRQRGYEKLKENALVESFDYEIINKNFVYKTDYDLGDIVTINKKSWGMLRNDRITEIKEIYEQGGMQVQLTLGTSLPETLDLERG